MRKGLFLASLLKEASAARGQSEEGMTEDKMTEHVVIFATGALMIAVIVRCFAPLKATTREVEVQVSIDEEQATSLQKLTVADLKCLCGRNGVRPGYGATRSAMIALLSTT